MDWTKNWVVQNNKSYKFFQSIQSSNITARTIPLKDEVLMILSNQQTHPVGRNSKPWVPSDFMVTWTWNQKHPIAPMLSIRIGLLFYHALQSVWPSSNWILKPPNDIYYKNKKLSGFLLETVLKTQMNQLILGVGINVLHSPIDLSTCLLDHFNVTKNLWENFLEKIDNNLNDLKSNTSKTLTIQEREQTLKLVKKYKPYEKIKTIDENGSLMFEDKMISWKDL